MSGKRGYFIVFEGSEGAGKSVQAELLANRLREEGYSVIATREPGGTRIGEQIRAITHNPENVDLDSVAESYLMAASRAQHVRERIEPALVAGHVVVCDRFVDSSIAYQGDGRKLGADTVAELNKLAVNGAIPDLVIILQVPFEVGLQRREKSAKKDRLDLQQKDFYHRVEEGYKSLAKKDPDRSIVIDGTLSAEDVAREVWTVVLKVLKKT
ncbi:dTMP kinase [Patescibacteria group bacterium]|nr:dTMP kinase [Patescibacteria group bacterium]